MLILFKQLSKTNWSTFLIQHLVTFFQCIKYGRNIIEHYYLLKIYNVRRLRTVMAVV